MLNDASVHIIGRDEDAETRKALDDLAGYLWKIREERFELAMIFYRDGGGIALIRISNDAESVQVGAKRLIVLDYSGEISREAGATAGQYTSPEDFQALILEAGRIPAERNTTYTRISIKLPLENLTSEEALVTEFA